MVRAKKRPYFSSIAVGILGILTAILLLSGCGKDEENVDNRTNRSQNSVLYINEEPVSEEEYAMLVREYCNQIYRKYTTEQVNRDDFWTSEIDGIAPYTLLEEVLLENLKRNYALKDLALEQKVAEDYTYADLMDDMDTENESRENQKEGEISYGLKSYDDSTYYKYWYSNLETKVVQALVSEGISVSSEDCRAYYEENIDGFSYEIGVDLLYAEIPADTENAETLAEELARAMENTDSVEELEPDFPDVPIERLFLNSLDTQEGMSGVYTQRWELASSLSDHQISGPYEDHGALCVVKCIKRTENGQIPFDDMKNQIEGYLKTCEAQEMIAERAESLKVEEGTLSPKEVITKVMENQ